MTAPTRHSASLTADEVADLVSRAGAPPSPGSPLAAFLDPSSTTAPSLSNHAPSLRAPWDSIVGVLLAPDLRVRVGVAVDADTDTDTDTEVGGAPGDGDRADRTTGAGPTTGADMVAYRRAGSPWVGFWPAGSMVRVESGLADARLAAIIGVGLGGDGPAFEVTIPALSAAAAGALLALADALRLDVDSVSVSLDRFHACLTEPAPGSLVATATDLAPACARPGIGEVGAAVHELVRHGIAHSEGAVLTVTPTMRLASFTFEPARRGIIQVVGVQDGRAVVEHRVVIGQRGGGAWVLRFRGLDDRPFVELQSLHGGALVADALAALDGVSPPT